MPKTSLCLNCGFVREYENPEYTIKKDVPVCIYCLTTVGKQFKIVNREIIFSPNHCRICNCHYKKEVHGHPKFYNVKDLTFYCGCLNIQPILDSDKNPPEIMSDFLKFLTTENSKN